MHVMTHLSRRDLLRAVAAGASVGLMPPPARGTMVSNYPANQWGTPGLYPARVVAMYHSGSSINMVYQTAPIQQMIRSGLMALTGASSYVAAWRQFVGPADIVGIKVNPNGWDGLVSSPAVIMEIVNGLMLAGVSPRNIIVYERYAEILDRLAGFFPSWLKTASASPAYSDDQTDITGYDPNHYIDLPLFLSWQDPSNPADSRSYAAQFVTRHVTKLINLPVLKSHNAAGVTLALKNLSQGCTNNVDRAHPGTVNCFTTYIPAAVSLPVIRYKAVLHIVDGIHALYEDGPYGSPDYTWEHKTMYFATDAVAVDRVGWRVVDAQRVASGLPVSALSPPFIGQTGPLQQPQYINSAADAGLGECRDDYINLSTSVLG